MTALIVGASGFLGGALVRHAQASGRDVTATYATRPGTAADADWHELDLRDPAAITDLFDKLAPRAVINAASRSADWSVTAEGAGRLARAAKAHGSRLVHISSDAVFSGRASPYAESCSPDPLTPYGAAKAAAETAVRLLAPDAVVARTSLIIGDGASEHERVVHDLVHGVRTGVVFTDDIRCPVHVDDLAAAVWELAGNEARGVCHLGGPEAVSRHELGVLIAERDGLDPKRLPTGRRADSGLPGGLDVRLDSRATQRQLRTRLRGAREFLGGQEATSGSSPRTPRRSAMMPR
ncbi:SDR family oxidoreductase [Streptomyces sp. NPDC016845]|uniref:SDR family oxidoreductase n=1 Tax=Streptomyces sp. NPDC016845 TaxID=3364972 RepID=UPI00378C5F26